MTARKTAKEVFMKNNIMVTVLTMVLTLALVLAGCSKKDAGGGSGTKALVGTWEGAYGLTWSFTGNKFTQSMGGVKQTVPYKIKGNSISTKYQDFEVEWDFEIDGDTLTIEVMGFPIEFKRVKNSGSGSVTYIGPETFPYSKLTSVTIPNSVTTIGRLAFYDYQLTSITIGRNVKTIGASAFYNNKLTSVTIPDSVTTIGWGAFYNNFGLTRVTIGANVDVSADPFPGNLAQVYTQGGRAAGTYKSSDGGTTWTNASGGGGMAAESGNSK
jgi:hypothetical protein